MKFPVKKMNVVYILCISLIVLGITSLSLSLSIGVDRLIDFTPEIAYFVAAMIIIIDRKRSVPRAAGIYVLTLAINNIFYGIIAMDTTTDLVFAAGLFSTTMGVLLLFFGIKYMCGNLNNSIVLFYVVGIMILQDMLSFIYLLRMGIDVAAILNTYWSLIPRIVANVIFIVTISSEAIKKNTIDWKMNHTLSNVSTIFYTDPVAYIERTELLRLNEWISSDRHGLASEIMIVLKYPNKQTKEMLVQYNDGVISAIIMDTNTTSYIGGFDFTISVLSPENGDMMTCKAVRIYGDIGMFVRLLVLDKPPPIRIQTYLEKVKTI